MIQIWVIVLQMLLKLLPFLYQLKVLRNDAQLKELQRRFEAAIRKAEEGALDSVRLREQHAENEARLRERWRAIEAGEPDPALPKPEPLTLTGPATGKIGEPFPVKLSRPAQGAAVYADEWLLYYVPDEGTTLAIRLTTGGRRKIRIVQGAVELASCVVEVG